MDGVAVDAILGADVVGLDPGFDDVLWVGHDPGEDAAEAASCEDPGGVRLVAPGLKTIELDRMILSVFLAALACQY